VFDATPLNQVLSEINRYSRTKVVLGDASLANVPIGGNFLAGGDTEEFLETLMAVLPLRSIRTGANEIVLFQRHTSLPSS
jgi:Fe2+-dicitrate sensor, membrane component